jgi:calcineurin-like phosphoesterase family protein
VTIWLSSDPHYGHLNIISYCHRPFSCVEEMGEVLVANHNAVVAKTDIVYCIGDFALQEHYVKQYLQRLNGTHILVAGNHDICHPANKRRKKKTDSIEAATQRYIDYGFQSVHLSLELDGFLLHHLPYSDAGDKRFEQYRPKRVGDQKLLCGHVHERFLYRDGMLNVGVDQHGFTPISMDSVKAFFATKAA